MLYQIFSSTGKGMRPGPRFRNIDDAVRYVRTNEKAASLAIRAPNGEWVHVRNRRFPYGTQSEAS